ncbi:MAG: cobalamin-binding protein [Gammaproteobacteria bacterium]|nr:cobalamin-binding protein [Gammaproteobacteria bacterium]
MHLRQLLGILLLLVWANAAADVAAFDDRGHWIDLPQPARRIVSLAPHVTELLFDAGAGERVVGVVAYSDYPPAARYLPQVGDASRIDFERVLALRPDLIVAWGGGNRPADIAHLRRLGIPVFISDPRTLGMIGGDIVQLGVLAGTERTAVRAADVYRTRLAALRRRYAGRAPLRVFYQVSAQPLITVGGRQIISRVLALCGARNVFARLTPLAPAISLGAVLAADPQAIIAGASGPNPRRVLSRWRRWPQLAAVRYGNLFTVPSDLIDRPTPRMLEGARRICADLERARSRVLSRAAVATGLPFHPGRAPGRAR